MLFYKKLIFFAREISESGDESSSDLEGETDQDFISFQIRGKNLHNFDFSNEAFRALPVEVQHEILLELRDTRKQSSWNRMDQMPQVNKIFCEFALTLNSNFYIKNFLKNY